MCCISNRELKLNEHEREQTLKELKGISNRELKRRQQQTATGAPLQGHLKQRIETTASVCRKSPKTSGASQTEN